MTKEQVLKIDERDNVYIALADLKSGEQYAGIVLQNDIPQKHKFLAYKVARGEEVIMYGVPVGKATKNLVAGSLINTENLTHFADEISLDKRAKSFWSPLDVSRWINRTFQGYIRSDGKVGTANYWLFVPLVFCENRNLKVIEEALSKGLGYQQPNKYESIVRDLVTEHRYEDNKPANARIFNNIDGLRFLYHHGGCGGTRQDAETLLRLLAGYVHHPNVAGATVLSLGCQHAQVDWFREIQAQLYPQSHKQVIYLEQQQLQLEEKLITAAIEQSVAAMREVNQAGRQPAPLSKLSVGLECGGSDGFSGISANPVVGHVSDLIVSLGGATILSEFPELNGVEQELINRCESGEVAEKFVRIQRAYEAAAQAVGSGFDMNPSPGNLKDGLITDAIKSAGAAKKGGTAPVSDVLDYTEPVRKPGLNLLCTPGNDVESTTGLSGSGANMILFTTGLGTPTGNPITPVIKISSNTELYNRMSDIIDFDAGPVIMGERLEKVAEDLLEKIIAVASGAQTKAMQLEQNDFIPWKRGVSL